MKTKLLRIDEIYQDDNIYPRNSVSQETCEKYIDAIKTGAKFPPLMVATKTKGNKIYILIDGAHRLRALSETGTKYVQAEVYEGLSDKEIYRKSIEANAKHGKPFDEYELQNIAERLSKEFKMSREEISQIVKIPLDKIERIISPNTKVFMHREIPIIKPSKIREPIYKYSGINQIIQPFDEEETEHIEARSQLKIIESLIMLIKNNEILKRNETIEFELKKLYQLLQKRYS